MARSYPRTAMVLPYPLALVAAPVTGARRWGALLLMWPAARPPYMTGRERAHIASSCGRLARLLEEAAEHGRSPAGGDGPRVVPTGAGRRSVSLATAAADFVERLPGGSCAVDLEGRFTYLSSRACELLGGEADRLLGTLPWQSLRWLDEPTYEDRYRAAVISREPVSFTACRPPDRWLEFHLYPDASGISVRIVPRGAQPPAAPASRRSRRAVAPARAGQLYQLTHLAAALTEVAASRTLRASMRRSRAGWAEERSVMTVRPFELQRVLEPVGPPPCRIVNAGTSASAGISEQRAQPRELGRAGAAHHRPALVVGADRAVAAEDHLLTDTGEATADRHGHQLCSGPVTGTGARAAPRSRTRTRSRSGGRSRGGSRRRRGCGVRGRGGAMGRRRVRRCPPAPPHARRLPRYTPNQPPLHRHGRDLFTSCLSPPRLRPPSRDLAVPVPAAPLRLPTAHPATRVRPGPLLGATPALPARRSRSPQDLALYHETACSFPVLSVKGSRGGGWTWSSHPSRRKLSVSSEPSAVSRQPSAVSRQPQLSAPSVASCQLPVVRTTRSSRDGVPPRPEGFRAPRRRPRPRRRTGCPGYARCPCWPGRR
ncbi:hypothetical protein SALBM311S_07594 [Streptomyces alboniger]